MSIKRSKNPVWVDSVNHLSAGRIPFFLMTHWTGNSALIFTEKNCNDLEFDFPETNCDGKFFRQKKPPLNTLSSVSLHTKQNKLSTQNPITNINPATINTYAKMFDKVIESQKAGKNYLFNLCLSTSVKLNITPDSLYTGANAPYKIKYKNRLICFSPESFIRVTGNKIETSPMKGTIRFTDENSLTSLMEDQKEKAEHIAVTDLLRNDLSMIATNVTVEQYRYPSFINSPNGSLIQTSTLIGGEMPPTWKDNLGTLLRTILPAGSVTGVPKIMATKLIRQIERKDRGFYTGIAGFFDGNSFDSCVLIRFLSKNMTGWKYCSGGGIMSDSNMEKEYHEVLDKIYVPY